jgi:general secretion pathway protein K
VFWNLYGAPVELDPGLEVVLQDTGGMVSPLIPSRLLHRLIERSVEDKDRPSRAVDALSDWQDVDDLKRLNGAEAWDYRSAGLPFIPRNSYIQSISELNLIRHFEPDLVEAIRDDMVYWPPGDTNYLTMSPDLLKAVIGDTELVAHIIDLRNQGRLSPALFTALTGIHPEPESVFYPSGDMQMTVTAEVESARSRIRAVVSRRPSGGKPFTILSWQR